MLDQTSTKIEELYIETGSYIDAVILFAERFGIYDYEDILEVIHPILKEKIKQEFIKKNYIPSLKKPSVFNFIKNQSI